MLARGSRALLSLLFWQATIVCGAVSPDPRLVQMVPPGNPIVAGVRSTSGSDLPRNYLMITQDNRVDLDDFLALTGMDPSRIIREVIFVGGDLAASGREHSLLISGVFGRGAILKYADGVRARTAEYRGIPVLAVWPFEREREYIKSRRWLAILESNIAVFGTEASVQCELDRYLDGSRADSALVEKLDRLSKKDVSWSVVAIPLSGELLKRVFGLLDPEMGKAVEAGGVFQLGFQFGRQVTVEYELTTVPASLSASSDGFIPEDQSDELSRVGSSLLSLASHDKRGETIHGSVKVPMHRYEEWLTKMLAVTGTRDAASSN